MWRIGVRNVSMQRTSRPGAKWERSPNQCIGLATFPIWLLVGWFVASKRYEHLSATLTETSIHLKKGYIMKVEKTIPLEKIQDLGMRTGPLLDMFGLASIQIETARFRFECSPSRTCREGDPFAYPNLGFFPRGWSFPPS